MDTFMKSFYSYRNGVSFLASADKNIDWKVYALIGSSEAVTKVWVKLNPRAVEGKTPPVRDSVKQASMQVIGSNQVHRLIDVMVVCKHQYNANLN